MYPWKKLCTYVEKSPLLLLVLGNHMSYEGTYHLLHLITVVTNWHVIITFSSFCLFYKIVCLFELFTLDQEILLLQKFNDIEGKVLKPKNISLQPQKNKMRPFFIFLNWDFDLEISLLRKKNFILTSKM